MQTEILTPDEDGITQIVTALRRGMPVAIPTETVYGLAAVATDADAVAQVFLVKNRPHFDPLIVHIPKHWETVEALVERRIVSDAVLRDTTSELVTRLMQRFWPGPLTLVLPRGPGIPDLVTNGLPSVALRMPDHVVTQQVLTRLDGSLAAPSANRFGRISPTSAEAVMQELNGKIPYILDGGPCQYGVESTVLAIDPASKLTLLRPGALARETIAQELSLTVHLGNAEGAIQASPGMLKSHYAPECSVILLESAVSDLTAKDWQAVQAKVAGRSCGVILTSGAVEPSKALIEASLDCPCTIRTLSTTGDDREAARRLFATLRELDALDLDLILVERCPSEDGLWLAIADRLRRASG